MRPLAACQTGWISVLIIIRKNAVPMSLAENLEFTQPETLSKPGSVALSLLRRGDHAIITQVGFGDEDAELERRLVELGFVEGARLEILHEGLIGRDPIAVRLEDRRVALRRREADRILVSLEPRR